MLIVIEGCVGAGKSTVVKGLAACRGSGLLLEDFQANPFLRAFYEDPVQNATETEFAFLLVHFHQLKGQVSVASRSSAGISRHVSLSQWASQARRNSSFPRYAHSRLTVTR